MAVVRPLYWNGADLQEMSNSMINDIVNQAVYLYGNNPTHTVQYYHANNGPWTLMDTWVDAGAAVVGTGNNIKNDNENSAEEYPSKTATPDPIKREMPWRKFQLVRDTNVSNVYDSGTSFPVYYDGSNIRAMSRTDFIDTFCKPAIQSWVQQDNVKGQFMVNVEGYFPGWNKGSNWIGNDTRSDISAFGNDYKEGVRQTQVINNFWLYQYTSGYGSSYTAPLQATSDGDLQSYSQASFDSILEAAVRDCAANVSGYVVRYSWGTAMPSGFRQLGSSLNDTAYGSGSGSSFYPVGNYQTHKSTAADKVNDRYYAQEYPGGSLRTVWSHYLGIGLM